MSQEVETMKFHAEIYQLMTSIINAFYESKEIFFKYLSQTARMYVIKLDINHLKMQRYLENKKNLRYIFFQIKKMSVSVSQMQGLK
jgi:HSP90 family molecular chaperone